MKELLNLPKSQNKPMSYCNPRSNTTDHMSKQLLLQQVSNWNNSNAKQTYIELTDSHGTPFFIVNKMSGLCVWKNKDKSLLADGIHDKLVIRDESVGKDGEFLYSYVHIQIKKQFYSKVMEISPSIGYDERKQQLYVRSSDLNTNYAMLVAIINVLQNQKSNIQQLLASKDQNASQNMDIIRKYLQAQQQKPPQQAQQQKPPQQAQLQKPPQQAQQQKPPQQAQQQKPPQQAQQQKPPQQAQTQAQQIYDGNSQPIPNLQ